MDTITQQNAALVEQAAAAAEGLRDQSAQLALAVSRFELEDGGAAPKPPSPQRQQHQHQQPKRARLARQGA